MERQARLEQGRRAYEAQADPVAWALGVLTAAVIVTGARTPEIRRVQEVASDSARWSEGHRAFRDVRHVILSRKSSGVEPDNVVLVLHLAELVASLAYNASDPRDPFDHDTGWWVDLQARDLAARVDDPRGIEEALDRASADASGGP